MDSIALYTQLACAEAKKITTTSPHYERSKIEELYIEVIVKKNYQELIAIGSVLKGIIKSDKGLPKDDLEYYINLGVDLTNYVVKNIMLSE